jgi:hypothetical protein
MESPSGSKGASPNSAAIRPGSELSCSQQQQSCPCAVRGSVFNAQRSSKPDNVRVIDESCRCEIRNPNIEIRNKFKIQNTNVQNGQRDCHRLLHASATASEVRSQSLFDAPKSKIANNGNIGTSRTMATIARRWNT